MAIANWLVSRWLESGGVDRDSSRSYCVVWAGCGVIGIAQLANVAVLSDSYLMVDLIDCHSAYVGSANIFLDYWMLMVSQ